MKQKLLLIVTIALLWTVLPSLQAQSQEPQVFYPVYYDLSPPLRDMPIMAPYQKDTLKRNPGLRVRNYPFESTALPQGADEAWQKEMGTLNPTDGPSVNFAGLNNRNGAIPPDTQGDVGPDHYFQVVNVSFQIWNKNGTSVFGPADISTIWSGFNPSSLSDPVVLYDEYADRWFVSIFKASSPYKIYVAVSQTGDPTGSWHRWVYDWATKPDYAKYSVWRDGYYYASNTSGGKDVGVFERSEMINGATSPKLVTFTNPNRPAASFHSIMPLDNDGTLSPSGTPGTFITINDDAWGGSDQLWIYQLSVNWSNTALSTFSRVQQIGVTAFNSNFGPNWDNIAQPGTAQELDAVPEVLMYRAQYRNFGSYQTIVCCHSVDVDNTDHAGVRWYELRKSGASWSIYQQSTYAPDAHSRWMGSISMNGLGDIALGYSVSSSTVYPSIRYTGRKANDPLNTMTMAEASIVAGTASQTGWNRWGDYSCMNVDPEDDIRFWFTTEHSNGGADWRTRVAAFSFSSSCYASGGCDEYISRVQAGAIDNSTGCINYGDYTLSHIANIPINGYLPVTITNGNGYASDQCGVWVDWNRDGDFSDANETVAVTGTPGSGPYTANVVAPDGLSYGQCTMRIRITYTGSVDPCGTAQYGEVEDYTLNIISPVTNFWTGTVSSNWHDPANWNVFHVPYATDNAYIAAGTPYDCWIYAADASCSNLTIQAGTYLRNYNKILSVNSNLYVDGQLMMDYATSDAQVYVYGNVFWRSGSSAWLADYTSIMTYGNMEFAAGSNVQVATGSISFWGTVDSYLRNYSSNTALNIVGSYKTGGAQLGFSGLSSQDLVINSTLYIQTGSVFATYGGSDLIVKGDLLFNGIFTGSIGTTLILDGFNQTIMPFTTTTFNNLTFSQTGTVTVNTNYSTSLDVNGDILIESGIFNLQDRTLNVAGNWTNTSGSAAFAEGTSRVVFDGPGHQLVKSNETFNILEAKMGATLRIDVPGYNVSCNQYDWTTGGVDVIAGSFTALDLVDNGIWGGYWLNPGGTINLTTDGWIDLNGNLNIYGGNFNVYGGSVNSDWPYSANASITMSGGILDFKDKGIRVYSSGTFTLTENITGGTIRTTGGFENQRSDFTPTGNSIEMYGTTDAYLTTSVGCSIYNVVINKGADDDGATFTELNDRDGKPIEQTRASTVFAGSSPLTILGNLNINSGTFDMNTRTVNVTNTVNINSATLKMVNAADNLTAYRIYWNSGSNDNVTNGVFNADEWGFWDGTNAQLGIGNTVYVYNLLYPTDDNAEFGNLVAKPFSKLSGDEKGGKAYYPIRVMGNFIAQPGSNWYFQHEVTDLLVAGNSTIENTAIVEFSQSDFSNTGSLTLAGSLILWSGSVATVNGEFIFPNTGTLNVGPGTFTNNYSTGSASLSGTLLLTSGVVEFPNRSVSCSGTFNDQISGGVFRVGKTLSANSAGTFQPLAGTVEFINASSGNYVQVTNGNYLYNMVLNKPGSSFQVYDDLTIKGSLFIEGGVLNSNNKTISIAGDWNNNVGTSAFAETTGKVIFNGSGTQYCSSEDFYTLEMNKPSALLQNTPYSTINCQVYDWTSGGLWISPGNFSATDLADDGLYGTFAIYNGTMDLHQDAGQYVDLNGSVFVGSGGTLNVYGGNGDSWWPYGGNATVTMNGGVLDFKDVGIYVNPSMTYTFTENITAGTIRTAGSFSANNGIFTPLGGTVELYGTLNTGIYNNYGSTFYNVLVNKTLASDGEPLNYIDREGKSVTLTRGDLLTMVGNVVVNGDLSVNSGKLYSGNTGNMLSCLGNVNVENAATLELGALSQLKLNNTLSVNSGGTFKSSGALGYEVLVTRVGSPYYTFSVQSGGNISADNTIFEYMGANGINVKSGAMVDLSNAFNYCTFRNGGSGQTLLMVNNDQELTCTGAKFPTNTWSGLSNITKWVNQGRMTFYDFSGGFSGPSFETDLFDRVDWFVPQLSATPTTINVTPPAGSTTFNISSNLAWTITESVPWFQVTPMSGSDNATITVNYTQNSSASARSGIITISAPGVPDVTVTVNQAGATLTVSPAIQNVTAAAGSTTFNVSSNTSWTVAESTAWFSVLPMSGSGNNTLTVTYTQNTSVSARSGQITVSSTGLPNVVVTVNQAGAAAILTVLPANRDVTPPAGTTTFAVTSNTGWAVSESVSWFSVAPASGTGNGTLTVNYGENATGFSRTGNITVTATGGAPVVTVTVTQESYPTHNIMLTSGWTGLSSYIMPVNNAIEDVFAPVLPDFIIAQTMTGMYYPAVPVNTIGDWLSQSAYKVKMSNQAVLSIIGNEELNKTFALSTGWNLVPVICNAPVNVVTLFPGTALKILKDVAGLGIYWPEFGINTIGTLLPGSAYYANMNTAGSVVFPANAKEAVSFEMPSRIFPESPWNDIEITASSHQIAILNQGMEGVLTGDILGVFDENGHCYGVAILDLSNENSIITAYANDEMAIGKTGFLNGELMQFRLYRPSTDETMEVIVRFDSRLPQQEFYQNEGLSAISGLKVSNVGVTENDGQNIRIFPNPAAGVVSVSGITEFSTIEIYTSDGSQVKTIQTGNVEQMTFDIANLSKGIYQLRFKSSQISVYKKLIKN